MSQILVFKNKIVQDLNIKQGITLYKDRPEILETILQNDNLGFMERKFAEEDENYRQIIPYCILRKGDLIFTYQRTNKSGENRLHDLYSLGVGGHSEAHVDGVGVSAFKAAFVRELEEEVKLVGNYESKLLGVILDNSNSVGRVHFGVVYEINLTDDATLEFNDPSLSGGTFATKDKLFKQVSLFENWSQLIIKEIFCNAN